MRKTGLDCEPPGEPEYQELLRLFDEEIASVREEFEYAEKANEESVAIAREQGRFSLKFQELYLSRRVRETSFFLKVSKQREHGSPPGQGPD